MKILSNPKTIVLILSANFIVLVSLFVWFYTSYVRVENPEATCNGEYLSRTLANNPLPNYEFTDLNGNSEYENLIKDKVLLVFLRSDCAACQKEVAFLSEHFTEISSQVRIIGVTTESKKQAESFIRNYKLQFPIILDKNGDMMLKARVSCTPTNFIIENGIIKKIKFGFFDNLEQLVKSL